MSRSISFRFAGRVALVSLQAVLLGGTALAQSVPARSVQMFDESPPLAVLRGIIVPEAQPGLTRRITLTVPALPPSGMMQASAVQPEPAAETEARPLTRRIRQLPIEPDPGLW